jgi:hypothetical protein
MPRNTSVVILCEDTQHEAFLRRFLTLAGWHRRRIRIEKSPSGKGSGEAWVRARYPVELAALRRSPVAAALVAIVDADKATIEQRVAALDAECRKFAVPLRGAREPVALIVPRRNIETWIAYLGGETVTEGANYPRLLRERECAPAVQSLWEMCRRNQLRPPAPQSLQSACDEFNQRLRDSLR